MRYVGQPMALWWIFRRSFRRELVNALGMTPEAAARTTAAAKRQYREILAGVPAFERGDRFQVNLVSCAMLGAFVLSMPERPDVTALTAYYDAAMMTAPMRWFCRRSARSKFSAKDRAAMEAAAARRAADRNPYSWNMEYRPYPDGSSYEARFTHCGICMLMRELGLYDLTPALCRLDYSMSAAGGASEFVRAHTLASGGPYCDCGYKKRRADTAQL